jgi:hypothetical protein
MEPLIILMCLFVGEMKAQVDKRLEEGVVPESHSPWFSTAILVPKKRMDGSPSIAFVSIL